MFLDQLLRELPDATVIGKTEEIQINAIAHDSRDVQPGALFVCIRGLKADGHRFADDAVQKGAVALVCEELPALGGEKMVGSAGALETTEGLVVVLTPDSRVALGRLAAAFYGRPSDKLRLIGVTGTNGKTTTTYFTEALLSRAGRPAGVIGTIGAKMGKETLAPHLTTPEPLELQRLLSRMVEAGVKYVTMEVSSHAMALNRVEGCEFDTAIFTNLSRDHFDFHRNFDDYFRAKLKLFSSLGQNARKPGPKVAVLNADDLHSAEIARQISGRLDRILTYGITEKADLQAEILTVSRKGSSFVMQTPAGSMVVNL
ncbi:MAG: Mur ligase family protein, partial [Syntrophothermus sp.]